MVLKESKKKQLKYASEQEFFFCRLYMNFRIIMKWMQISQSEFEPNNLINVFYSEHVGRPY